MNVLLHLNVRRRFSGAPPFITCALLGVLLFSAGCGSRPPKHGVEFVVQVDTATTNHTGGQEDTVALTADRLKQRLTKLGIRSPYLQTSGSNDIVIRLPSLSETNLVLVRQQIQRSGTLEFHLVHANSQKLIEQGLVPPGYEVLTHEVSRGVVKTRVESLVVKKQPEPGLSGSVIEHAAVTRDNRGRPEIAFTLDPKAGAAFAKITRDNIGRQLAILVEGKLSSAPIIQSEISGGQGVLTGDFTMQEAYDLATVMETPLPAPVKSIEEQPF